MRSVKILLLIFYFVKGVHYYFVAAGFSLRMKIPGVGIFTTRTLKGAATPNM
jgi:hypothetical protein